MANRLGKDAKLSRTELEMYKLHDYLKVYYGVQIDETNLNMPLVEHMAESNIFRLTRWSARLDEFSTNDIHEAYGLSFNEFMDMPTVKIEYMLSLARKRKEDERRASETAKRKAEKEKNLSMPDIGVNGFNKLDMY